MPRKGGRGVLGALLVTLFCLAGLGVAGYFALDKVRGWLNAPAPIASTEAELSAPVSTQVLEPVPLLPSPEMAALAPIPFQ